MSSQPPPKQRSIASMFWDILRLSARMMWGSRANPVRPMLERQQALALMGLPSTATRQQIKRRYRELAKKYRAEMALDELREARDMTQQHLAKILGINQAAVSKMERRADMYISTLQDFVRAMGGQLVISVVFPEGGSPDRSIRETPQRRKTAARNDIRTIVAYWRPSPVQKKM